MCFGEALSKFGPKFGFDHTQARDGFFVIEDKTGLDIVATNDSAKNLDEALFRFSHLERML